MTEGGASTQPLNKYKLVFLGDQATGKTYDFFIFCCAIVSYWFQNKKQSVVDLC